VRLEGSTKPHFHKKIHEFLINMAFTMACPNFKKGLEMAFGPLGIKVRNPILLGYASFHTMDYKDIREFLILYLQDIC
jgi:hypothetical protein